VSLQTGPLAGFAEADAFIIDKFSRIAAEPGIDAQVIVKDSQSNPNRAVEVPSEVIIDDEVHLMLVNSTLETTNPVATICEGAGMPVISTKAPCSHNRSRHWVRQGTTCPPRSGGRPCIRSPRC